MSAHGWTIEQSRSQLLERAYPHGCESDEVEHDALLRAKQLVELRSRTLDVL